MFVDPFSPLLLPLAESIGIHMTLDGKRENNICLWEVFPIFFPIVPITQYIHP